MRHYYLFQAEDRQVTAVAAAAMDQYPISDELGEALADGGTVTHGIAMYFLRKFGGRLIDAEGGEALIGISQPVPHAG